MDTKISWEQRSSGQQVRPAWTREAVDDLGRTGPIPNMFSGQEDAGEPVAKRAALGGRGARKVADEPDLS